MRAEHVKMPPNYALRDMMPNTHLSTIRCSKRAMRLSSRTPQSPNLRAHMERLIETHHVESLDKLVLMFERHLNPIYKEFKCWYIAAPRVPISARSRACRVDKPCSLGHNISHFRRTMGDQSDS